MTVSYSANTDKTKECDHKEYFSEAEKAYMTEKSRHEQNKIFLPTKQCGYCEKQKPIHDFNIILASGVKTTTIVCPNCYKHIKKICAVTDVKKIQAFCVNLRTENKLTRKEVAIITGVSRPTISKVENGQYASAYYIIALLDLCSVPIKQFISEISVSDSIVEPIHENSKPAQDDKQMLPAECSETTKNHEDSKRERNDIRNILQIIARECRGRSVETLVKVLMERLSA